MEPIQVQLPVLADTWAPSTKAASAAIEAKVPDGLALDSRPGPMPVHATSAPAGQGTAQAQVQATDASAAALERVAVPVASGLPTAMGPKSSAAPSSAPPGAPTTPTPTLIVRLHYLHGLGSGLAKGAGAGVGGGAAGGAGSEQAGEKAGKAERQQEPAGGTSKGTSQPNGSVPAPAGPLAVFHRGLRRLSGQSGAEWMDKAAETAPVEMTACGLTPAVRVRCILYDKAACSDAVSLEHPFAGPQKLALEAALPLPAYLVCSLRARGEIQGGTQSSIAGQRAGQNSAEDAALLTRHSAAVPPGWSPVWPLLYIQVLSASCEEAAQHSKLKGPLPEEEEVCEQVGLPVQMPESAGQAAAPSPLPIPVRLPVGPASPFVPSQGSIPRETTVVPSQGSIPRETTASPFVPSQGSIPRETTVVPSQGSIPRETTGFATSIGTSTAAPSPSRTQGMLRKLSPHGHGKDTDAQGASRPHVLASCSAEISRLVDGHIAHPVLLLDGAGGRVEATLYITSLQ